MELSYDKYEARFWLSIAVPLWLDRLFNPYYEGPDYESLHPDALVALLLRPSLELAASELIRYTFADPVIPSRTTYTMTKYPALPTGQE